MERNTLTEYAKSLETGLLKDIQIGCDSTSGDGSLGCTDITDIATNSCNTKVQYGQPVTVAVSAAYVWMLPLSKKDDTSGAIRTNTNTNKTGLSELGYEETNHNIVIKYTVPGLKYYPDLN